MAHYRSASVLLIPLLLLASVAGGLAVPGMRAASAQEPRPDIRNLFEGNPIAIERGASRYSDRCVFCHGTRGRGAKGPCLVCGHWKFGGRNVDLYRSIAAGRPGTQMGAFAASLNGEEIWQIIAFLRDEFERRQAQAGEPAKAQ
jgi:mono/diheme cytochrome c family protein